MPNIQPRASNRAVSAGASSLTPVGSVALGLALVGVAAVVVSGLLVQRISASVDEIRKRHSPALESILELRGEMGDGVWASMAYLAGRQARQKQASLHAFSRLHGGLDRFATLARVDQPGEERERGLVDGIRRLHADVEHRARSLFDAVDATSHVDPAALRAYEDACRKLLRTTDELAGLEHLEVKEVHALTLETIARARLGLWAVAATVVLLTLAVGIALRRAFLTAEQATAEQRVLRDRFVERSIAVQDSERRRVARELHDETGQSLTALAVGLRALTDTRVDDGQLADTAARLQGTTESLVHSINRLVQGLHPQVLEDLGWVAAIEQLLSEFRAAHGVLTDLDLVGLDDDVHLAPDRALAVYRVVQEALTNVARHAAATHVSVCLTRRAEHMRVIVEDDGRGFDPLEARATAIGLQSMRERATSLGGQMIVESTIDRGTTVVLDFPLG